MKTLRRGLIVNGFLVVCASIVVIAASRLDNRDWGSIGWVLMVVDGLFIGIGGFIMLMAMFMFED